MIRDHVLQDELDFDTQQGRWEPVKSLFEDAEPVFDLEPEVLKKPGKWMKCGKRKRNEIESDQTKKPARYPGKN